MADQKFTVNSGFFDAIDLDRLYSADQMNKPYKRLVSNGVFPTNQGTPSTDLMVLSDNTLTIKVQPGEGLFGDKWFENPAVLPIVVPPNNSINPRIDSVIVQVDTTQEGRCSNIIYRTGTASTDPVAPEINTETGKIEYRVANVTVVANAVSITQAEVSDLRGSEECPWVTGLITQVDTSVLFAQWQTAYQQYYDESTAQFEAEEAQRTADWEQFWDNLTQDLSISTNVVKLVSQYTTATQTDTIPVQIASYNPSTDILFAYINGIYADGSRYTYSNGNITLSSALDADQTVYFVCLKSVITGDIATIETMLQQMNDRITALTADTQWVNFTMESGSAYNASNKPSYRRIGDRVYIRGMFKDVTGIGVTLCTLPAGYRPAMNHLFTTVSYSGTTVRATCLISVKATGEVVLTAASSTLTASWGTSLATDFVLG